MENELCWRKACEIHSSAVQSGARRGEASCGTLPGDTGRGVRGQNLFLTPAGSSAGPLCEQHVGVRERHVPRQPLRTVLLPARLRPDADGHRCGPPPGEGSTRALPCPPWRCLPGRSGQCFSPFIFKDCF